MFLTLLVCSLLLVSGCQPLADSPESRVVLSTSEQVLGFAAISAVEELQQDASINRIDDSAVNHEKINSQLYVPNTFLSDVARFDVDVQTSSQQGFEHTMIITYVDMNKKGHLR